MISLSPSLEFLDLSNKRNKDIIDGVKLHGLSVHSDQRGDLVEVFKETWKDVGDKTTMPFGQSYYSVTNPGHARDEDRWHYHPHQIDRFVVVRGRGMFALYDWRKKSKTYGKLNLFLMSTINDDQRYMLLIPANVLHSFCALGSDACYLFGFPTYQYTKTEEKRIAFADVDVRIIQDLPFSWQVIRDYFRL